MTERRESSVALFLMLFGVCAYFANERALGTVGLILAIPVSAVAAVVVCRFDQIEKLTGQWNENRRVLIETKHVSDQVFAKADEVRRLAAGVATFSVASMLDENRCPGVAPHERMSRRRDELQRFLSEAGVDTATIQALTRQITSLVDLELRRAIVADAASAWHPIAGQGPNGPIPPRQVPEGARGHAPAARSPHRSRQSGGRARNQRRTFAVARSYAID